LKAGNACFFPDFSFFLIKPNSLNTSFALFLNGFLNEKFFFRAAGAERMEFCLHAFDSCHCGNSAHSNNKAHVPEQPAHCKERAARTLKVIFF